MPRSGGAALPRSCGRAFWSAERDMISQRQLRGLFPSRLPLAAGGSPWGLSRSLPAMLTTTSLGACLGRNYARPAELDPKCTVPSASTQPGLPAPGKPPLLLPARGFLVPSATQAPNRVCDCTPRTAAKG